MALERVDFEMPACFAASPRVIIVGCLSHHETQGATVARRCLPEGERAAGLPKVAEHEKKGHTAGIIEKVICSAFACGLSFHQPMVIKAKRPSRVVP